MERAFRSFSCRLASTVPTVGSRIPARGRSRSRRVCVRRRISRAAHSFIRLSMDRQSKWSLRRRRYRPGHLSRVASECPWTACDAAVPLLSADPSPLFGVALSAWRSARSLTVNAGWNSAAGGGCCRTFGRPWHGGSAPREPTKAVAVPTRVLSILLGSHASLFETINRRTGVSLSCRRLLPMA